MTTRLACFSMVGLFALVSYANGQTFKTLHSFPSAGVANPSGGLALGKDGSVYGTISGGSSGGIFKVSTNGIVSPHAGFSSQTGGKPLGGLTTGLNDYFYGSTTAGGKYGNGAVFFLNPTMPPSALESFFYPTVGRFVRASLVQTPYLDLYGVTSEGGSNGFGSIFKMGFSTLTAVFSFNSSNGANPSGQLIQTTDGLLYGTTLNGGAFNQGTVFKLTTNGVLTSLMSFSGTNGAYPSAGLMQAMNGQLYGTTGYGGSSSNGTVFHITTNGVLSTVISFNGINGSVPSSSLTQWRDGSLYGTTYFGGESNLGTVFRITTNGVMSTLLSFKGENGANPSSPLLQGKDSSLYGTTLNGGTNGFGTVFQIAMPVELTLKQNGNKITLAWPTNAAAFTLQAATDSPTNWNNLIAPTMVVGSELVATIPISGSARFYRLKK